MLSGGQGSPEGSNCPDTLNNGASNNGVSNSGTSNNGGSNGGASNNGTSNNGTSNNGTTGGTNTNIAFCNDGEPCACSNGLDDDQDGLTDGFDPECTGPFDDDEESFGTGIPGDNRDPKWQDCFFDGNSGAGDDGCRYHTDCLTGVKPPEDKDCTLSQECLDFCRPRTPNGCDCFGCCEIFDGDTSKFVTISDACSVSDFSQCETCIPSTQCVNTCGRCELCAGKTLADLPDDCNGGGGETPVNSCDGGETVCTQESGCSADSHYCIQGCCVRILG